MQRPVRGAWWPPVRDNLSAVRLLTTIFTFVIPGGNLLNAKKKEL